MVEVYSSPGDGSGFLRVIIAIQIRIIIHAGPSWQKTSLIQRQYFFHITLACSESLSCSLANSMSFTVINVTALPYHCLSLSVSPYLCAACVCVSIWYIHSVSLAPIFSLSLRLSFLSLFSVPSNYIKSHQAPPLPAVLSDVTLLMSAKPKFL